MLASAVAGTGARRAVSLPPTNYSVDQRIHRRGFLSPVLSYAFVCVHAPMPRQKNGAKRARKGESQPKRERQRERYLYVSYVQVAPDTLSRGFEFAQETKPPKALVITAFAKELNFSRKRMIYDRGTLKFANPKYSRTFQT